jgi:hypothetical protein
MARGVALISCTFFIIACSNIGQSPSATKPPRTMSTTASDPSPATSVSAGNETTANSKVINILQTSSDRNALVDAAKQLADAGDPQSLAFLEGMLVRKEFLARLDELHNPSAKTYHFRQVFLAIENRPSAQTAELCLHLLANADFLVEPDRKTFVIAALFAVRPMSKEAAHVIKQSNTEGYFSANLPLLTKNGSPRALALFEEMILDKSQDTESLVGDIHSAVLPQRTNPDLLVVIDRLLAVSSLDNKIVVGLVESIFDHQSRRWFGPTRFPPLPPEWETAPDHALKLILALSARARTFKSLNASQLAAVDRTTATVRALLTERQKHK